MTPIHGEAWQKLRKLCKQKDWHAPTKEMVKRRRIDRARGLCVPSAESLRRRTRDAVRAQSNGAIDFQQIDRTLARILMPIDPKQQAALAVAEPQLTGSYRLKMIGAALGMESPYDPRKDVRIVLNPTIEPMEASKTSAFESCLSAPWVWAYVTRWKKVRLTGTTLYGEHIDMTLPAWSSRLAQLGHGHLQRTSCADEALQQGRNLYFVPPELLSKWQRGTNKDRLNWPLKYGAEQWEATLSGLFSLEALL